MRRTPTRSEELLWQALRGRALGVKFRRQHPIGPYIVDFFCAEASLVVEVDGAVHLARAHCDRARDAFLAHHGLRVMRVPAWRVERQLSVVLRSLRPLARIGYGEDIIALATPAMP